MTWSRTRPRRQVHGHPHRQARARLLAAWTPGQPCCLCQQPTWTSNGLHADHCPTCLGTGCARCAGLSPEPGYRGLAHPRCNISDGSARGRARQAARALRM